MMRGQTLETSLSLFAQQDSTRGDLVAIIKAVASAGIELAQLIARHDLEEIEPVDGSENTDGDIQKPLDLLSNQIFESALDEVPLTFFASEEREDLTRMDPDARYGLAIDPLDGSFNIETNMSIGSIFSIFEVSPGDLFDTDLGHRQRAAGFLFYGPKTLLVLTWGEGTRIFLLDETYKQFVLVGEAASIPPGQHEFAINTSNYRFWDDNVRHFINDCIAGEDGNLGRDFNMRWNASLVAEAFRILMRGGVFLYPGDSRPSYRNGRLRLLYEALPLAMVIEQAGGRACDGSERILDKRLESLHQRVPLIFGSHDRVEEVIEYISGVALETTHFPLFEQRGLFRN